VAELPEPALPALDAPYALLAAGVGGTGVVTIGALVGMAAHLDGLGVTVLDMTGLSQKGGAVMSHVRIARRQEDLHAVRIATGQADAVLGCDIVVATGSDALSKMRHGRTRVIVNTAQAITGEFVRNPHQGFALEAMQAALRDVVGGDALELLDATRLATLLLGHSIGANMFLLGFAWQRRCVPVSRAALMRAIELNAVAVADNQRAFDWGRRAAFDAEGTQRLAASRESLPEPRRLSTSLDEIIARRGAFLVAYQDERYAQRYAALVGRVREAESRAAPGSTRLAEAVARNAFRVLANKDEYEVARLYADGSFAQALQASFEGDVRVRLHLAIPGTSPPDPITRLPAKRSYGPWMLHALRWLARLKPLRGTPFDVFGYATERRLERARAAEYLQTVDALIAELDAERLPLACEIASLPDKVRGFGPVRQRHAEASRAQQEALMADWARRRDRAAAGGRVTMPA